jgi:hypothetical protein
MLIAAKIVRIDPVGGDCSPLRVLSPLRGESELESGKSRCCYVSLVCIVHF